MATLYRYQERVYQHLMNGKNVILQAPTGAGKTRAALYPYFENLVASGENAPGAASPLPLTCRYAVPMRVLATQFEREYHDYFAKLDRKRGTRFLEQYHERLGINVPAIQTGETPNDPKFESPLTFCTIDQLLASFIGTPYSLSPRLANLNVGAVVGSYLILDEFHLYPLEKTGSGARMTALAMLSMLKGLSPFVMMTATFSTRLLQELGNILHAEIVRVEDQTELDQIMAGRSRTIRQVEDVMTPEAILAAHDAARERGAGASLVVCNTVARAQDLYSRLREALMQRGRREETQLVLLHSRFTPEDRQRKSAQLEAWLGEKQWHDGQFQGSAIVVGTQAVEVGLNISAGVLHTELAPANSLIQRAGRCARFRQQRGDVLVYRIPPREDGTLSTLPYDEPACDHTWNHLWAMIEAAGTPELPFGFSQEQALIDAVHTEDDTRMLEQFHTTVGQKKHEIMGVLASHERGKEGELIRNVSQVAVLIHPEPEKAITVKPFIWESFGLYPGTLAGAWKSLHERREFLGFEHAPEWVMKELVPGEDPLDTSEEDSTREAHYGWKVVTSPDRIGGAARIALPPELATYDAEVGFRLLAPAAPLSAQAWQSRPIEPKKAQRSGEVRKQRSYVEHISGLMRAYDWSARRELAWVAARLENVLSLPASSLDHAVRLAIACHDLGKLSKGWQSWASASQDLLVQKHGPQYQVQSGREWLAKTDGLSNWQEEKQLQKELRVKKPKHACIGVMASAVLIGQRLMQGLPDHQREQGMLLAKAALSAIARHHAPTAKDYDATEWQQDTVRSVIAEAFKACRLSTDLTGLDLSARAAKEVPAQWLITPGCESDQNERATWLGFVLARTLRLCDQRAEQEL